MPPPTFAIVIGLGSVVALFGLVLLLTVLTRAPRAKPTLLMRGREWHLRGLAILGLLVGGLCLGFPVVYGPAGARNEPSEAADRSGSHAHKPSVAPHHNQEHHVLDDQGRGHVAAGGSVARETPGPRQPEPSQGSSPHDPLNLTGEWTVTNTVVETSYAAYRDLRLGFRLVVQHDGPTFTGVGEKYLENGRKIPRAARRPIRIQGWVAAGAVIEATFQEDGSSRQTQGRFRLTMQDRQHLTGTFVSTAANTSGASQWLRTSVPQGAPADQPRRPIAEGRRTVQSPGPSLHLGMSQSEVRALLGEPVSIEDTAEFVFWHYGAEAYVVFERGAGRVHGWLGVSSGADR